MRFLPVMIVIASLSAPAVATAYGEPDGTFAAPAPASSGTCSVLSVPGDQGVLVSASAAPRSVTLARYTSAGALDGRWGSGGRTEVTAADGFVAHATHRTADGGFIVIAHAALKVRADGSVDTTYGTNGFSEPFSTRGSPVDTATTALMGDGRLVAQFHEFDPAFGGNNFVFTRYLANGTRDTTFGAGGFVRIPRSTSTVAYAWGVQPDGQVQLATHDANPSNPAPQLHRFPNDFTAADAAGGRLVPRDTVATWMSNGAVVDAQGRLWLAAGCAGGCAPNDLTISRYAADGGFDPAFNGGGPLPVSTPGGFSVTTARALHFNLEADGSATLLAFHGMQVGFGGRVTDNRVYRVLPEGRLDPQAAGAVLPALKAEQVVADDAGRLFAAAQSGTEPCTPRRYLGNAPRSAATLVEYQVGERYFITAEGFESNLLDNDPAPVKLRRTGHSVGGWLAAAQPPGSLPVCRFYGDAVAGPVGHFYSLQGQECALVRADDQRLPRGVRAWRYEGLAFNEVAAGEAGACFQNLQPVYRLYNDAARRGGDSNHRFTTDPAVVAEMQGKGWILEGAAFCAPPARR